MAARRPPSERPAPAPARAAWFAAAVAVLIALAANERWSLCRAFPTLPLWDEAAHGVAGVQVADALRHANPLELLQALNRQVVWPFVHSLLLAPVFLIGGNSVASAEWASLALWGALIAALFWAGLRMHPTRGALAGLLAASLALLSPEVATFGTLAMLEVPGALLLTLAFALHARAAEAPESPRRVRLAGIATTALFLCKYNYGLLWLTPVALWEWGLLPAEFRARAIAAVRGRMTPRWWLRPMPLLLGVGGLAALRILVTGGGSFELAGQRVSMRSPGNLAYALWLAGLAWVLPPWRGQPSIVRRVWSHLPARARGLVQTVALPLAIWFTMPWPNRMKEFFGFVANRDSGASPWDLASWTFYPRAFAADYSPAPWVAWSVLALAIAGALLGLRRSASPARRLAALALIAALGATMLHRYRDSRFFFTVCPPLWLCASATAVAALDALLRRLPGRRPAEVVTAAAAAVVIAFSWLASPGLGDVRTRRAALRGPVSTEAAMDEVLDAIAPRFDPPDFSVAVLDPTPLPAPDPNRDYPLRAVLLGYGNVLSPGLLDWRARQVRPDIARALLPKRAPFVAAGAEDLTIEARARWIEDRADLVIVALADSMPASLSAEYRNEVWADRETAARLAESGNWARLRAARLGEWRVEVYRRGR